MRDMVTTADNILPRIEAPKIPMPSEQLEHDDIEQQRIHSLLKNGKKALIFRKKMISPMQLLKLKCQQLKLQNAIKENKQKDNSYSIFDLFFGTPSKPRGQDTNAKGKLDANNKTENETLSSGMFKFSTAYSCFLENL